MPSISTNHPTTPNHRDRPFFIIAAIAIIIAATSPYLIGWASTPAGKMFYGNAVFAPADSSVYYSYIEQGRHGGPWMYDAFTSEAHSATLWQPLWWLIGRGAELFNLSTPVADMVARVLCLPILLGAVWWALGWVFSNRGQRRLAFILTMLSGGLGGLLTLWQTFPIGATWAAPIDLWVSEAFASLTMLANPHFILVTAGIVFTLTAIERSWAERSWRLIPWAGLSAAVVFIIHPFHLITWLMIWGALTIGRAIAERRIVWGYIGRWSAVLVIAGPMILTYLVQYLTDPLTHIRAIENINLMPDWSNVVYGLIPLVPLALFGWWRLRGQARWWLLAWAGMTIVAMYLPLHFQRRLSQGISIPLTWLATPAIFYLWQRRPNLWLTRWGRGAAVGLVGIMTLTWPVMVGKTITSYDQDRLGEPRRFHYLSSDYISLAAYLRTNTNPHQPLLATFTNGNIIAGLTAHQVYLGIAVETIRFGEKLINAKQFYGTMTITEQQKFLQQTGICYVLDGPRERAYGTAWQPQLWPDLRQVWRGQEMALYQTSSCR